MSIHVSLYNPRSTPPEQLEALLVGREPLLKELLDNLQEQARGQTRQHWLIRGPRGMGKTHLTGIIHHRVSNDPELSGAYLPLWLGEADVYEVYSPATLLERIAERLVEVVPDSKLSEKLQSLVGTGDEEGFFQELSAHLAEEAARLGKILLVLMENLDALLEGFAPKERKAQLRQLRSLLLHDPHFLFISTTPTKYMSALTNPKEPLYNQFKERSLKPLTVEEVGGVFAKLVELTERKGMEGLLGDGPDAALRRKVIHQLTGGLPRSVVMAFEVMRDKTGIQPLVEDLRALLDAQTAYFEARLSKLPPRERAIVTVMALAPKNLTIKEIAEKSRLQERSLSTLMSRLLQDGHVEVTHGAGGKGTVYGLSEGLFRLWYQYRKGRLLLEPLVNLLAYLYSATELRDTVTLIKEHMAQDKHETRYAAQLALLQVEEALRLATSEEGQRDRERLWKKCLEDVQEAKATKTGKKIFAMIQDSLGPSSAQKGRINYEALAKHVLDDVAPLPDSVALECIYFLLVSTYEFGGIKPDASLEFLRRAVQLCAHYQYPAVRKAMPLFRCFLGIRLMEAGEYEESLQYTEEVVNYIKEYDSPFSAILKVALELRADALQRLGRTPDAIAAYKKFIQEAQQEEMPLLVDGVIRAFRSLAKIHSVSGNRREEEAALREIVRIAIHSPEKSHRDILGRVKFQLAILKSENGTFMSNELVSELENWIQEFSDHSMIEVVRECYYSTKQAVRAMELPELAPNVAAEALLSDPSRVYSMFGAKHVKQMLSVLAKRELDPKQADAIRLHSLVADSLVTALLEEPEANTRLRAILGQIPPELHQMVEELIEVERKWRKDFPKRAAARRRGKLDDKPAI